MKKRDEVEFVLGQSNDSDVNVITNINVGGNYNGNPFDLLTLSLPQASFGTGRD